MALFGSRLSKLAQFLATGGTVPETAISTAETDTDLRLAPDGAGGVEWGTGGGGSGDAVLFYPADIAPASPDAQDEEFTSAFNVTPTFVSNSGTATSGAILPTVFDSDSGPTTNPRYNVNSDVPGHFVMQSLNTGKFIAYWPFAPGTGTDWCVLVKALLVLPANASAGDAAVHIGVSAVAPTTAANEVANSIVAEMRTVGTVIAHSAVTPGVRTAEGGSLPGVLYAGIIGRDDNSITIVTSNNGLDWRRKHRIASGTSPAGALITQFFIYIRDINGSGQGPIALVDFIRYNDSSSNLYTLMGS